MRRENVWCSSALLLTIACAHAREPAQVSDADFGRLSPEQTQPVDRARQDEQTAREELARAKLGRQKAEQELQMAQAEQAAAEADAERAEAAASAADASRVPSALQRAAELKEQAQLHRRSADAHVEWARKLIEAREAEVAAAEQQLELTQAQVANARLEALRKADVPASTKYDAGKFVSRVNHERADVDQAQRSERRLRTEAETARLAYEAARQRFQASVGTYRERAPNEVGTGAGSPTGPSGDTGGPGQASPGQGPNP